MPDGLLCIMEALNISSDQLAQALAWINGQESTLGEKEVLQMLRSHWAPSSLKYCRKKSSKKN